MNQTSRLNKGLTLIELLIVVAILLIITSLSTGFYSRFLLQNAAANTVDQLTQTLRKAQVYSMMGKRGGQWGVNYINQKIIIFQGSTYLNRNPIYDEKIDLNPQVNISGFSEIVFSKTKGLPNQTASIRVSAGNSSKTIAVNQQGVVNR